MRLTVTLHKLAGVIASVASLTIFLSFRLDVPSGSDKPYVTRAASILAD